MNQSPPRATVTTQKATRGAARAGDVSSKITLTVTDVQRFLGKSKRAFYLLRRNPAEGFPAPFVIRGRDHWLMRDLLDWIERRRRRDAIPGLQR
jgi:hypothetical protein